MVEKIWKVIAPEGEHVVRLLHNPFSGWLIIYVDSKEVYFRTWKLTNIGVDTTIRVGRLLLTLKVERCGEACSYSLVSTDRVHTPQAWPLPPGVLHLPAARENIIRTAVYTVFFVLMALMSIIVYTDIGAMAGLLVFGIPSLVYCWRLGDLIVTRLEFNSLGIAQQGLLRRKEIAWNDVEQVLVDQDGQCWIEGNPSTIILRAGVYTDLRPLAWWVEFMAGKGVIRTPRFRERWLLRYSKMLLPISAGLVLGAVIWLDTVPVIIGIIMGLGAGGMWASRVGVINKFTGDIPFIKVLLLSVLVFGFLLPRINLLFIPLLMLGGSWGLLLYVSMARDELVQLMNNQGLHI